MGRSTDLVEGFLEAFEQRDLDRALALLAPDVYFVQTGDGVMKKVGDFSGHAGFTRWWEGEVSRGLELYPIDLQELDDTHVFAEVESAAPDDGGWMSQPRGAIWTIAGDKIAAIEVFEDPDRAYIARPV